MQVTSPARGRLAVGVLVGILLMIGASPAAQAQTSSIRGRLLEVESERPVAGAIVFIEEFGREVESGSDGSYAFDDLPAGTYHLIVAAEGYTSRRVEVVVLAGVDAIIEIEMPLELHFTEVISVSPEPRDLFDAYQPIAVLAGQDLSKQLEGSLGATLATQPGVAERSLGPSAGRPVIRGLDGARVLILEDGQRMGDLSSQSGDHGITINTASTSRIEVVRGPATAAAWLERHWRTGQRHHGANSNPGSSGSLRIRRSRRWYGRVRRRRSSRPLVGGRQLGAACLRWWASLGRC